MLQKSGYFVDLLCLPKRSLIWSSLQAVVVQTVSRCWKPNVTHIIAATDANGAYTRTLKVLMAILNGRWIVAMDWIKACQEANKPVDEESYEASLDNHGCRGGAKTGRLQALGCNIDREGRRIERLLERQSSSGPLLSIFLYYWMN